ncbi:MAG: hypothetical protein NXI27_20010 [Alphaproteobacteria bacterium]|nr:hypothetical protein [Alphaproteobacteria bacterium]
MILGATALVPSVAYARSAESLMCGVSRPVVGGNHQLGYHLADRQAIGIEGTMRIDLTIDRATSTVKRSLAGKNVARSTWSKLSLSDADRRAENLPSITDIEVRKQISADIDRIRSDATGRARRGWMEFKLVPDTRRKNVLIPVRVTLQLPPLGNLFQAQGPGVSVEVLADDQPVLTAFHKSNEPSLEKEIGAAPMIVMEWDPKAAAPTRGDLMVRSLAQALLRDQEIRVEARIPGSDSVAGFKPARPFRWSKEYPAIVKLQPFASKAASAAIGGDISKCEKIVVS